MELGLSQQLDILSKLLRKDLEKLISNDAWVVRQIDDFTLKLTRKIKPCEGFEFYISVLPESRASNKVDMEKLQEVAPPLVSALMGNKMNLDANMALDENNVDRIKDVLTHRVVEGVFKKMQERTKQDDIQRRENPVQQQSDATEDNGE